MDEGSQVSMNQNIPEVYSNSVDCGFTPYDFIFRLGLAGGQEGSKQIMNLRISPQHAKVLSAVLTENVAEYEKKIGKIALPKEIEKNFGMK